MARNRPEAAEVAAGPSEELSLLFDIEPEEWLRAVPGRGTFRWPAPPGGAEGAVVKRFRGDSRRERVYELLRGRNRRPAQREFDNLTALAAEGLTVPAAIGWVARGDRSLVAMAFVPHTETLRERLAHAAPGEVRAWLERVLALVLRLHERGWYHRDLYLQHFLVQEAAGEEPRPCLIDVGRARRETAPRARWHVKDLGALLSSTPSAVPLFTRLRFLAGYLDARHVRGRARRRRWARRIEARRRSIAGHAPRHGEEGDPLPGRLP